MSRDGDPQGGPPPTTVVTPAAGSGVPFWWLRQREALLRRFVMAQALAPPRSRRPWGRRPGSRGAPDGSGGR